MRGRGGLLWGAVRGGAERRRQVGSVLEDRAGGAAEGEPPPVGSGSAAAEVVKAEDRFAKPPDPPKVFP